MAVQMLLDGHSQREVARILCVSQSVVARMRRRYQETGQFTRRPGQGRSRCTTDADDRYIRLLASCNRRCTATRFQTEFQLATGQQVSTQTIRNRLHNDTMNARRPATGPIWTRAQSIQILDFTENHLIGKCMIGSQCCSQMRVDSICRHVIGVFVCGEDQANGMQTVTLWNTIGMGVAPLWFGWNLFSRTH